MHGRHLEFSFRRPRSLIHFFWNHPPGAGTYAAAVRSPRYYIDASLMSVLALGEARKQIPHLDLHLKSHYPGCKHTMTMQTMPDLFAQTDGPQKSNLNHWSRIDLSSLCVKFKRGPRCPEISRALPRVRVSEAQWGLGSGQKHTERLMLLGPHLPEFWAGP